MGKKKEAYESVEFEIIRFRNEDIITESLGGNGGNSGEGDGNGAGEGAGED